MEENKDTEIIVETIEAAEAEPAKKTRTRAPKAAAEEPAEKKTRTRAAKAAEAEPAKKTTRGKVSKTAVEEPAKKTRSPRAAKKPEAAEPEISVVIQYGSREVAMKDVTAAAVEAYKAAHEGAVVQTVTAYVKPEENAVYYVVNGDDSEGSNKLDLFR